MAKAATQMYFYNPTYILEMRLQKRSVNCQLHQFHLVVQCLLPFWCIFYFIFLTCRWLDKQADNNPDIYLALCLKQCEEIDNTFRAREMTRKHIISDFKSSLLFLPCSNKQPKSKSNCFYRYIISVAMFVAKIGSHISPLCSSLALSYISSSRDSFANSSSGFSTMASTGHASWQYPQKMQRDRSISQRVVRRRPSGRTS